MSELDPERLQEHFGNLFGKVEGALTCALAYLGDKLGLYAAVADAGPTTAAELAERTGLKERWLLEWLRQQSATGIVTYKDGRFSLSAEAAAIYAAEDSLFFGAGVFDSVIGLIETLDGLQESFRTGVGAPFDAFGPKSAAGTERIFAPFYRNRLVQEVLPSLEGVVEKLRAGGKVADVGCGAGVAVVEMGKAFPASEFHAFDNSRLALGRATANRDAAGVENVVLHDTTHQRLEEDGSYDLITTFDCIHDMTHPVETIGAIRCSLKPDGTWFAADIRGFTTLEENLARQPFSGMLYGFSVICCMRAALSTPDGAGLGTLGFTQEVAHRVAREAGFTRFTTHDFENPLNEYYEVRP